MISLQLKKWCFFVKGVKSYAGDGVASATHLPFDPLEYSIHPLLYAARARELRFIYNVHLALPL